VSRSPRPSLCRHRCAAIAVSPSLLPIAQTARRCVCDATAVTTAALSPVGCLPLTVSSALYPTPPRLHRSVELALQSQGPIQGPTLQRLRCSTHSRATRGAHVAGDECDTTVEMVQHCCLSAFFQRNVNETVQTI
jgi:hypothetical protein